VTAPTSEYEAARHAAALASLPGRALLAVTGPQRVKFLHGILSNDVAGRGAGQGCLAALMDAKGHVQALLRVLVAADTVWLEVPAARLDAVEALLVHYRVAAPVRIARPERAVMGLIGPAAREVLDGAGLAAPDAGPEDHVAGAIVGVEVLAARASDLPGAGWVLHVPAAAVAAVEAALRGAGATLIDRPTLDVLRIEDGIPWFGPDVTEANILHETGLVARYHSPTKGCYVGQEVIARLEARGGNVNKALRGLLLQVEAAAGDAIVAEGAEVGRITTAGESPRRGPIALGYVHRSRFEPGTQVEVRGAPATVTLLPMPDLAREPAGS
jgi:folate-binding protein YgfZ